MANTENENSAFYLRWKTIWDEEFPDKWLLFIRSKKLSIQDELRESLTKGIQTTPPYESASYVNFLKNYAKNRKDWKEIPSDNRFEEYFLLMQKECFVKVLEKTDFRAGSLRPSWVTEEMMKLFFNTMEKYRQSHYPLPLFQLCCETLGKGDAISSLPLYFGRITDPLLRTKLFHPSQVNSE